MTDVIPELAAVWEAISRAQDQQSSRWERLLAQDSWTVYTDGSAPIKNPGGAIGFSSIFLVDTEAWEVYGGTPGRTSEPATSNNRAEIAGALAILEVYYQLSTQDRQLPKSIEIVCDSQYVVHCAQGKWKKHKNKDLWRRFDQLMCVTRRLKTKVDFRWTRAHVGTEWNERADVLAKDGAFLAIGRAAPQSSDIGPLEEAVEAPAPKPTLSSNQYTLSLYSKMAGSSAAKGVYRLATPSKDRVNVVDFGFVKTLDEAEYQTLIHGLTDLLETLQDAKRNPADFTVGVESCRDLMLKQIEGKYGVKSERLLPLHKQATGLARKFARLQWLHTDKTEAKSLDAHLE